MPLRRTDARRRNPFGSRLLGAADQSARALRIRVQVLLTALLVTTNVVGAALVFVISYFVVPAPEPTRATVVSLAIAVPVYVAAAVLVGAAVGTATTLRALRWATTDSTPDDDDRRKALRVPLRLTLMQALMWLVATVLFTGLSLVLQPSRALSTGLTVGIAGLVSCGVAYLLTEFTLRPLAARALAGASLSRRRPRGAGVGGRMVLFWWLGTGAPVVGLVVAAVVALTDDVTSLTRLAVTALVLAGVILVFGFFLTVLNARSVVAPILSVRDALLDVERGDLDREVPVYDGTELGLLQAGFNEMVHGLREREHLRDMFGRHVGRVVADAAAKAEVELGGETRTVTVVFVDLVGSTTYATEHSPAEVVQVLNRFFAVVVDEVDRHGGLVNKFIGDAVLAIFGAPVELDDHAGAALASARAMAARLAAEVPEIGAGIGVATGEVVAGNVGHRERFEYTVIGDAVNSAARLTDLAKGVDGRLLATWATVEAAGEEGAQWSRQGSALLRGRPEETELALPCPRS
ncbi:adenylate/guanylate cyclase domain-containing protein [Nocardioides sp. cx-169]|uniref:adenylate/guanylate cyclase domain-containing protein n=1 Tax=Nocardioides sp. cx-169 TaxID=2899080 RepID=UPI001E628AB8|nr:adenylate/guanylate cyclase domain-containing protein [Nocardioides sp. cx-169]MCD4532849.1 adenylate/guanylate cyclase domain-containing protein [Nocardioides sp. cx-169]